MSNSILFLLQARRALAGAADEDASPHIRLSRRGNGFARFGF
jgi:hypothetical protein